jgi:hypothetical protein
MIKSFNVDGNHVPVITIEFDHGGALLIGNWCDSCKYVALYKLSDKLVRAFGVKDDQSLAKLIEAVRAFTCAEEIYGLGEKYNGN